MKSMRLKILVLTLSLTILISGTALINLVLSIKNLNDTGIETIEKNLQRDYDALIKSEVETIISILVHFHNYAEETGMPKEQELELAAHIVREARYGESGYFWADTSDGTNVILLGRDSEGSNRMNLEDVNGFPLIKEIIKAGMNGGGYTDYWFPKKEGGEALRKRGYSLYFEPYDWIVGTGNYTDDIDEQLMVLQDDLNTRIIAIGLIMIVIQGILLIVCIVISLLFSATLTKPLIAAAKIIEDLSSGQTDLSTRLEVQGKDEIARIGNSLNTYLDRVETNINDIKKTSDEINTIREELNTGAIENLEASKKIDELLTAIAGQTKKLNTSMTETQSSTREISQNSKDLDNDIVQQSAAVEESTSAITEMVASLKNVSDITTRQKEMTNQLVSDSLNGQRKLETTQQEIRQVADNIDDIKEMATVINQISSQTNLLAMNAAIEAAHAGDTGKGFAVVADEIRKLAESSAMNVSDITNVLNTMVSQIENAVETSNETYSFFVEFDKSIKSLSLALEEIASNSDELFTGGNEILNAMSQLTDVTVKIKERSATMDNFITDVSRIVEDAAQVSYSNMEDMERIAVSGKKINQTMEKMKQNTDQIDKLGRQLTSDLQHLDVE